METDDEPVQQNPGPLNITIAPEALRLNQQLQESLATSHGKFLLPDGTVPGVTSMQVDHLSTDQKQVDAGHEEQPIFLQETKTITEQHDNGHFSHPHNNTEPISLNTSDLNSILKSLDDKPLTLQEMLSHPTQISCQSSFPPTSSDVTMNISVANSDQTTHLTNASNLQHHSEEKSLQQPVHSPVVNVLPSPQDFNGMMFNSLANNQPQSYENTSVYGDQNLQVNNSELKSDSDKVMTSTETDSRTFEQIIGNAHNQHDFVTSPNNTEIISNFHSDLNNCQNISQSPGSNQTLQQIHGTNQNLQQILGSSQNLQQTFSNNESLQQNLGDDQNLQRVGSGQTLQQNLTNSPDLQQNSQQNVICVNFSNAQNTPSVSNIQNSAQVLQGFPGIQTCHAETMSIQNNTQEQGFSNLTNMPQQKQNIVMAQHMPNQEVFTPTFTGNASEQNISSFYVDTRQTEQDNVLQGFTNSDSSVNISNKKTEQGYDSLSAPSNVNTNTASVASADNTGQQSGYSDVAMRLLQQLLTKSTNSTTPVTNQVSNSSQSTSNVLYSSGSRIQPAIFTGIQSSPSPMSIPTTALQQVISSPYPQPRVQISNQGLLHHILSQGLVDKRPEESEMPTTNLGNVKPEVQQLDSLRLQAMAQQVQQQAQQAQNAQQTTNGNQSRGPQIIVLGGNSGVPVQNATNSAPAAASASPILILAGGGGDNNNAQSQVENILRSILGSLKPGQ
ncbi:unnamed protein product [Mytilus coruscus]|nr:unnamed protein product [Mytilus coruscus]